MRHREIPTSGANGVLAVGPNGAVLRPEGLQAQVAQPGATVSALSNRGTGRKDNRRHRRRLGRSECRSSYSLRHKPDRRRASLEPAHSPARDRRALRGQPTGSSPDSGFYTSYYSHDQSRAERA